MGLNTSGIIFIALAWTVIFSLITFCFYKVFKTQKKN